VPIQENISWTVGFAVPAGAFALALILFATGYKQYIKKKPSGSSLGRVFSTGDDGRKRGPHVGMAGGR